MLLASGNSEEAGKVMVELLGIFTKENASLGKDEVYRGPNIFLYHHLLTLMPVKFLEARAS